jgi:hypothetical protein
MFGCKRAEYSKIMRSSSGGRCGLAVAGNWFIEVIVIPERRHGLN